MSDQIKKQQINSEKWFLELRNQMVGAIEKVDGSKFEEKKWQRPGGGGGLMSVLKGDIFEKVEASQFNPEKFKNFIDTNLETNIRSNVSVGDTIKASPSNIQSTTSAADGFKGWTKEKIEAFKILW